ncbi:uncharacterized protein LOC129589504 [Paramacrobiotus metropolitanus]|uniref:uncharacterized protein LOC129589504 n=1 Tax=Paramacrobiotus metropolitanus TaxID=2943436 RepID=UPI0024464C59|nr:uncharacterized protein LOC129589504 [Paramacrobiotus metropolitanus]XP_055340258.1 uncharacterized protein LOC129589504 [Paramacrobiotus metropolitanus]XP_055340259.1 uncharacterized protein LOC129589504 [Paramacrobiotus metropolitanus]XP_055340260.1 uncharacterized protein LOC129589504 [Paramacrobiotus metropolitanus]
MYRPLMKTSITAKAGLNRNKPCGILMGQTGAGKSTLGNMLCGTKHASGASEASLTQLLFRNDVCVGRNAFSVIDTPGTDSQTDTYKHALQLRAGLTATELNTIFIVLKYENRYNKMVDHYLQVEQPVGTFTNRIVILLSHMDNADDHNKEFSKICGILTETSPKIDNIIFFSKNSDPSVIADLMYACMSHMVPKRLKISDEDFRFHFNLYEIRMGMRRCFDQYRKQVNDKYAAYCRLRDQTKTDYEEDQDELFHAMIVQFKFDIDELYQEFVNKHGQAMVEMDCYALSVQMQRENVRINDEFVSSVTPLMTYNLFDNMDPRNQIKACPHCGLIWWKTEGCDGTTNCGNRVTSMFDVQPKALFKYTLKWVNGELVPTKNHIPKLTDNVANATRSSKGVGCGKAFVWTDIPKLNDEIIFQIFEVKTMEEVRNIIRTEGFQRAEASYLQTVDLSFHE